MHKPCDNSVHDSTISVNGLPAPFEPSEDAIREGGAPGVATMIVSQAEP